MIRQADFMWCDQPVQLVAVIRSINFRISRRTMTHSRLLKLAFFPKALNAFATWSISSVRNDCENISSERRENLAKMFMIKCSHTRILNMMSVKLWQHSVELNQFITNRNRPRNILASFIDFLFLWVVCESCGAAEAYVMSSSGKVLCWIWTVWAVS